MSNVRMQFRLPEADVAIVYQAIHKAATDCDYPPNSSGSYGKLLEMMCIDLLSGGNAITSTESTAGKRESLAIRVQPMRLPMIDFAICAAREAGAPDDSIAIYWISRAYLGMTDPPGQADTPVGAARHQGAAGKDHATNPITTGTAAGEPQGTPHPSGFRSSCCTSRA